MSWCRRASLLCVVLAPATISAASLLPPGTGIILPVQDRVGDPDIVAVVESVLASELSAHRTLADAAGLRDELRRLRIRDPASSAPDRLEVLAGRLRVDWFLTATLHEAIDGPVPQITLSGKLYEAGQTRLTWSGFEAASGLEGRTWLGLGETDTLDRLAATVSRALVDDLATADPAGERPPPPRLPASGKGFLLDGLTLAPDALIAVVPFNSVADRRPMISAETITDSFLTVLHQAGFAVIWPGALLNLLRQQGQLFVGEIDRPARDALASRLGARWILTGWVETYEADRSAQPNPWVAFSGRLLDAQSGRIVWIDGDERLGRRTATFFERGRIYSAGLLAHEMTRSLVAGLSGGGRRANR